MPPWGAVKGFGDLSPDYGLSQEDILIIAAWVVGGAPQGNLQLLPPAQSDPKAIMTPLKDEVIAQNRVELNAPVEACGIRPITGVRVDSAKLVARLPDGRTQPLVWLYRFDPKMPHTFTFRKPLDLPKGTVVEASAPVRFALESALKAP